jgi:hypothetical protein
MLRFLESAATFVSCRAQDWEQSLKTNVAQAAVCLAILSRLSAGYASHGSEMYEYQCIASSPVNPY